VTRADYHAARRAGGPLPLPKPLVGTLFWMQRSRRRMVVGDVRMERKGWAAPGSSRRFLRSLKPFTNCVLPGGAA
jgi:hypothetical protein